MLWGSRVWTVAPAVLARASARGSRTRVLTMGWKQAAGVRLGRSPYREVMDVASYSQFPFIYYLGVSLHHPPSIITHSLARASAHPRAHNTERANWSPTPTRRATRLPPHSNTLQPTRRKCGGSSSLGVWCFSSALLRSGKRPSRRIQAFHRREETTVPTHETALGACTTPSVWGRGWG